MKNSICPGKGSWMCREVDGNCSECEAGENTGLPIKEKIKIVTISICCGYLIGLLFNIVVK